jgi:hypothetical protein
MLQYIRQVARGDCVIGISHDESGQDFDKKNPIAISSLSEICSRSANASFGACMPKTSEKKNMIKVVTWSRTKM